jgi:hypothetical protein
MKPYQDLKMIIVSQQNSKKRKKTQSKSVLSNSQVPQNPNASNQVYQVSLNETKNQNIVKKTNKSNSRLNESNLNQK